MPHKHKRRRDDDGDQFNLPPTSVARPLAVRRVADVSAGKPKRNSGWKQSFVGDDTPKAFTRLMQFSRTGKGLKGLDDGNSDVRGKKRKRDVAEPVKEVTAKENQLQLSLLPGERLKDFSARVDQALPMGGLVGKGKHVKGLEERRTRHEKRLRKMQAAWREEDARIKDREAEAKELAEEEDDEQDALYSGQTQAQLMMPAGKKSKRRAGTSKDDDDPWEELKKMRDAPKGLHDVAQAPPELKAPKAKFKVRNGARANVADVPNAAGSLRRREELGQTRKSIIESYRMMMEDKRNRP